ncbi:hypothetical protein ZIOFF_046648 [Zingiber officinale]|uniref:Bidirectional sugar transporter SWEET n=1 Tax=Zingiber officinale TaxID=94328 RepID=A0A8J5FWE9_ZINOF|nr:hypothetical protein ZIOFF_046648 [Zingiber officinale]
MWVAYGLPAVHPHSMLVITINGSGLVIELAYVLLFVIYSRGAQRARVASAVVAETVFVGAVALLVLMLAHTHERRSMIVGILCVCFGTMMYAAPLSVMTKSVEYMPLTLSLVSFFNGLCWTAYALIRFDPYITIPNGLGVMFAVAQLVLYAVYYKSTQQQIADRKRKVAETVMTEVVAVNAEGNSKVTNGWIDTSIDMLRASTLSFASARDRTPHEGQVIYYGVLTHIIKVRYMNDLQYTNDLHVVRYLSRNAWLINGTRFSCAIYPIYVRCCEFLLSNFYTNRSEYSGLSLVHDRTSPGYWASAQGYPTHNKEKLLGRLVGGDGRPHMRCLSTIPAPNVALGSSHLAPSSSNAAHISLKSIPEGLMQMIIDKIGECVLEKARAEARDEVVVALENFFQTIVAGANNDPNR